MTGKERRGRQEVWLINPKGEFSVAGLLQHVGDPSLCLGLQLQRSLSHLSISLLYHHTKTPLNTSDRCLVNFIVNPALPSPLHISPMRPSLISLFISIHLLLAFCLLSVRAIMHFVALFLWGNKGAHRCIASLVY